MLLKLKFMIRIYQLLFLLFATQMSFAQQSKILESQSFKSKSLKREAKYSIYLPAGYEQNNRTYPVLYLLHGYTGNEKDWVHLGETPQIADKNIANGTTPPMIIVMPDGQNSWYINAPVGNSGFEDFIIKDLIPHIDSTYRTRPQKDGRAIAGLSMGGNGAFCLSLKYPTLFGAAVVMSGAFFAPSTYEQKDDANRMIKFFEPLYGKDFMTTEAWQKNSPFLFLKKENIESYNTVKILFDCGDDDFVTESQLYLSLHLRQLKVKHELRIREGVHDWKYWREALPTALQFCGEVFHH